MSQCPSVPLISETPGKTVSSTKQQKEDGISIYWDSGTL